MPIERKINNVTYEIQRVYTGNRPISELLQDNLTRQMQKGHFLTSAQGMRYNIVSESGQKKEVT